MISCCVDEGGSLLAFIVSPSPYKTHSTAQGLSHSPGKPRTVLMYLWLLIVVTAGSCLADGTDSERLCLIKRGPFFQQITPCSCPTGHETLLDLGKNHVPRYLASFTCQTVPCYRPPFVCTGLPYKVKVLKRRDVADDVDMSVPESLRAGWTYVNVHVNVGCVCTEDSGLMKRSMSNENTLNENQQLEMMR